MNRLQRPLYIFKRRTEIASKIAKSDIMKVGSVFIGLVATIIGVVRTLRK